MIVLMFHSIGNESTKNWYENKLSMNLEHFETFCRYLYKNQYQTGHLDEWYEFQDNSLKQNKKTVFLTFDDGYLDNWVYAYPILKKYGLKSTIFINPEFVEPSQIPRPNLENVWNREIQKIELNSLGFLNWQEIKQIDHSGIMDVQSHSMSHDFVFCSNEIIDIYKGQSKYYWLSWIYYQDQKPYYLTNNSLSRSLLGIPVFKEGRALGVRAYFPDQRLLDFSKGLYIHDKINYRELVHILNKKKKEFPGRYETDEEMEKRYRYELITSKQILERKLNKDINFLCWPGGGYNKLAHEIAIKAGYIASTIGTKHKNEIYDNTKKYKRIPRSGIGSGINVKNKRLIQKNRNYAVWNFKAREQKKLYKLLLKFNKAYMRLKYYY